ncbi:MAG: hypothetical protein QNJ73_10195 [Gammaproteobacteria bacterium]|nr:hypothetical protein [Gammaproteobacteria bacterium]
MNFIADQHLTNLEGWPNPPDGDSIANDVDGNPFLLPTPGHYIQRTVDNDQNPFVSTFKLTTNHGGDWSDVSAINPNPFLRPVIVGAPEDPYVYQTVERPGTTANGFPRLGLMKISRLYDPSGATVVDADVTGLGSVGIFPTMFAWYPVLGANPWNPSHLIVADVETEEMKYSLDGGQNWSVDTKLTKLLTDDGRWRFRYTRFPMATTIAFDPYSRCHILVGTVQNGIFRSTDGGFSWVRVKASGHAANVSSFYFPPKGPILVSTYGRGLWRLKVSRPTVPNCLRLEVVPHQLPRPSVWDIANKAERSLRLPPDQPSKWCPECSYIVLTHGGMITDLQLSNGQVSQITMNGGFITQFDGYGNEIELDIPNVYDPMAPSPKIATLLDDLSPKRDGNLTVRGIVVEDRELRGVILSESELPVEAPTVPEIRAFSRFAVGGVPIVEPGEKLTIYGRGFAPSETDTRTTVAVDGRLSIDDAEVDKTGRLRATITVDPVAGSHEIVVKQQKGHRLSVVRTTALAVPGDEPEDGEANKSRASSD